LINLFNHQSSIINPMKEVSNMISAKVAKKPFIMLPSEVFEQLNLNEGE